MTGTFTSAPTLRSKTLKALGTLAVAGLTVGLGACGDDGGSSGASSPEEAVEGFWNALAAGDCSKAANLVTDDSGKSDCEEEVDELDGLNVIGTEVVNETDDYTTVEVTIEYDGIEVTETEDVIERDGGWLIDNDD